jgi:hypothetical protein
MGQFIIKLDDAADTETYVIWSEVVDGPTGVGTREQVEAMLIADELFFIIPRTHERLDRAHRFGWSAHSEPIPDALRVGADKQIPMKDLAEWIKTENDDLLEDLDV